MKNSQVVSDVKLVNGRWEEYVKELYAVYTVKVEHEVQDDQKVTQS